MLMCIVKQNSYVFCEIAFTKITYHGPVKSCFWWKMFQLGNTIPTPCLGSFKQSINIYTTEITFVGIHLILFDLMSVIFSRICINYLTKRLRKIIMPKYYVISSFSVILRILYSNI